MNARAQILVVAWLTAATPVLAQAPVATGLDAWKALVGNTIIGETAEGDALVEYFAPDGVAKHRVGDDAGEGAWTLRDDRLCTSYSGDDEDGDDDDSDDEESDEEEQTNCYGLKAQGDMATLTDESGAGRAFRILPGNAERL